MAVARQIVVNPANKQQRYILYTNGFMQAVGGAIQPTPTTVDYTATWNVSNGPPLWQGIEPARAMQVTDWSVPKGYTIDTFGAVWPWGGAAAVAGAVAPATGGPEYAFGTGGGFPSPFGYVQDFMMDPAGGGTGYMLLFNGDVIAIGTGVTAVAHGPSLGNALARRMIMDWTSKRYWILDTMGRISGYNGGNSPVVTAPLVLGVYTNTFPAVLYGMQGDWNGGDFALYDVTANPKGWQVDSYGRVWNIGSAQSVFGFETSASQQWNGIGIVDDGLSANPLRLVQMTVQGRMKEFVVSTKPTVAVLEPVGVFSAQNKPWVGWQYIDREGDAQSAYEVRIANSTAYLAATTNEVQTIASTGGPTGGTFKLGFQRVSNGPVTATAAIAYNASAATVQAALEALPSIGTGGVVCTGGPIGTAGVVVTFSGAAMAGWNWPLMSLYQNALTGGTTPTITRTMTTPGVGANPASIANVFSQLGTDTTVRVRSTAELANSTAFRAFVRGTDSSALVSDWDFSQFSTAFTALNAPTITVDVLGTLAGTRINVTAATGAGLPGTARFGVQFSDDGGVTWLNVRNGDALVPSGSGAASVVDYEAPHGIARAYRAVTYVYTSATDLWQQSAWSATVNGTLGPKTQWTLTNPNDPSQGLAVRLQSFETVAGVVASKFFAVTRDDPIVMSDGKPKYPAIELNLWSLTPADRAEIEAMCNANTTLQVRNYFGESWYVRLDQEFRRTYLRAGPSKGETTPLGDAKSIRVTTQAVKRPVAGPTTGPLAES